MVNAMKIAALAALVLAGSQAVLGCVAPVPCPPAPNGCDPLPGTCPLPSGIEAQLEWVIDDNGDLLVFLQSVQDVAGFQFDVVCSDDGAPVIFSGIGGGSSSDNGFLLSFGTDNGRVLGFSLTQAVIPASESFALLVVLGLESECSAACIEDSILPNIEADAIPQCGACDMPCDFPGEGDCTVSLGSDPVIPGVENIGFDIGIVTTATGGLNDGELTFYLANTVPVAGFQFNLRCEGTPDDGSSVVIQNVAEGQVLQGLGLLTNFNNDIVLTFSISGTSIPPGVGEVLIISTTSTCLAAEICFVNGVFSDPLAQSLPACGGCGNKCTCAAPAPILPSPSPLPPSPPPTSPPPPTIPDGVPPFVANICVEAGLFNFVVLADLGTTTYIGTDEAECIVGTSGSDSILGGGGDDIIFGLGEDDYINGGDGSDVIYGNLGLDIIIGYTGNDALYGGVGNDLLFGDFGDDYVAGEEGFDTISGGPGSDTLVGGPNNDKIFGCDELEGDVLIGVVPGMGMIPGDKTICQAE